MANSSNRFTHIIFDFDGTLFDTAPAIVFCLKKAFSEMGYENEKIDGAIAEFFAKGIDLKTIAWQLLPAQVRNQQGIEELMKHYRALYQKEWMQYGKIFSDVQAVIKSLAQQQMKIIIVSNKGETAIEQALAAYQLSPYVCCIVGDRAGIKKKPSSECYERIIQSQFPTIVPEKTLMVGDSLADGYFARNVGMRFCWAEYGYGDKQQIYQLCQPDYVINNLRELYTTCCETHSELDF